MSKDRTIAHSFEGEQLESVFVGRRDGQARPTVILIPTVMGVSDLEIGFGRQLVELGYNALVADLFGKKFRGAERDVMLRRDDAVARRSRRAPPPAAARARAGARDSTRFRPARSSPRAIALAASARSTSPAPARILLRRSASTACSTRPDCRRRRSGPRSSPSMAGTIRWCRRRRWWRLARS